MDESWGGESDDASEATSSARAPLINDLHSPASTSSSFLSPFSAGRIPRPASSASSASSTGRRGPFVHVNEARAHNEFFTHLDVLRSHNQLCDVELVATAASTSHQTESERCEQIRLRAHRVVLAAASPYLSAMFTTPMREASMEVIEIKEVNGTALATLIDYMYTGKMEMDEGTVQSLLATATMLGINDARDVCSRFLLERLDSSNCLGMASFAATNGCSQLSHAATVYCQQHFRELVSSEELLSIDEDQLHELIADDRLTTTGEQSVYEAVLNWVRYDPERRKEALPRLLGEVRLPQLPDDFLLTVSEEPLLIGDERCKDLLIEAFRFDLRRRKGRGGPGHSASSSSIGATPPVSGRRESLGEVADHRWARPRMPIPLSKLVFLVGGQAPKAIASVDTFDLDNHCFATLSPLPQRRCRCGVAALDGLHYAIGGFNGSQRVRFLDIYDPERDSWHTGVPMDQKRSTLGVAVLAHRHCIMAVGGFDGNTGLSSTEAYDPRTGRWQALPSMAVRRSSVAVAAWGDGVYALGGYDGYARQCLNTVEIYEARANKWRLGPPLNQIRSGAAVAILEDTATVVAIGGHDGPLVRRTVEALREDGCWEFLGEMSTGRRNASVVAVGNTIVALGGDDGQMNLDSIEFLAMGDRREEVQWQTLPVSLPQPRSYAGVSLLTKK